MNDTFETSESALAAPITEERPWAAFAACRDHDPEVFFPVMQGDEQEAIQICRGCPVQADCLDFAMETNVRFGVWGGLPEKQRQTLRRQIA